MITADQITLHLGGAQILRDVSVPLEPGRIYALCGPNGAGKSTLLSCLAGEHPACASAIRYFDTALPALTPAQLAQHRVVLEQNPFLAADFTLLELVELGAPLALPPADLDRITSRVMGEFGFGDMADRYVSELSGGQQHRAHFARVLVQLHANLHLGHLCALFLDEPTASLDLGHQITMLRRVRALARSGVPVLMVLHDLNLAAAFTDEVMLLKEGRVVTIGPPDDVLTASILGSVYDTDIIVETASTGQRVIQPVLQI